jgi:uncharacterized repeat protein (TIGR03803 family)
VELIVHFARWILSAPGAFPGRASIAALFLAAIAASGSAQTYTDLYDLFDQASQDGSAPRGPLLVDEFSGAVVLRGTASNGGAHGLGTLFSYDFGSSTFAAASFDSGSGGLPIGGVTLTSSGLFGTAYQGGGSSVGTVWSDSGGLHSLYTFSTGAGGSNPGGPLLTLSDPNTFWGTASAGGSGSVPQGVVFRLSYEAASGSWAYSVLHSFDLADGGGGTPFAGLIQASNGSLYGTNENELFRIDPDGTGFAVVAPLDNHYNFTLLQASDGYLYGRSDYEIYRLDLSGSSFVTLRNLSTADGQNLGPFGAGLVEGTDGLLYGTSDSGGANGLGTIFRIAKDGNHYVVLHDFAGPEGASSSSGLVMDSAGNFYGTASAGGAHGNGVLFRFVPPAGPRVLQSIPTAGPVHVDPGDPIELVGDAFPASPGVTVGGLAATGVEIIDGQHIQADTPPDLSAGTLNDIVVSDPGTGAVGVLKEGWFADFLDVPEANAFHGSIESIVRAKVTAGCGGGTYCPTASVTRAQMAVFLLKSAHGPAYAPPPCTGIFADATCTPPSFAVDWIEELYAEGITAGCAPGLYCPERAVSRKEMAVLLLKTQHGADYVPPACAGIFADVPCPGPFADWIEQLHVEDVTAGCGTSPPIFCPDAPNTRGQMAVFLARTFGF